MSIFCELCGRQVIEGKKTVLIDGTIFNVVYRVRNVENHICQLDRLKEKLPLCLVQKKLISKFK
jgi:ribosome-binding protein aMBF1 (putative translation factor)